MRFASLGSGSKGNATVVSLGTTCILVDCGFSVRETERRLQRLGLSCTDLDAVFVTHEHSDHSSGVARLARRHQLPVYMTHGTYHSGRCGEIDTVQFCASEKEVCVGGLVLTPVSVPHDAREPCQFVIRGGDNTLGILTDLGSVTPFVTQHFKHCDALLLEFNHDPEMLFQGTYPENVKRRVGGDWGHLNNRQSAELLASLEYKKLQHLVIAHISEQNNKREIAEAELNAVFPYPERVAWADQADGFDWLELH